MRKSSNNENEKKYVDELRENRNLMDSFNSAIEGIVNSINTERNMKVHILIAILILGISVLLDFTRVELIIISITIVSVLSAELINTAIETLTDLESDGNYNELAKRTKDISAGAVLLTAINSIFVAYLLIYPKIKSIFDGETMLLKIMDSKEHLLVISVAATVLLVIFLKGVFYKTNTTFLKGGSVSGHSALAFNLATIGSVLSKSYIVSVLFFGVAVLVAQSRVESKTHTILEVILGGLLGVLLGLIMFFRFI